MVFGLKSNKFAYIVEDYEYMYRHIIDSSGNVLETYQINSKVKPLAEYFG